MEITYIGHASFKIKGKDLTIVIDPYDPKIGYKFPKQKADLLLTSHQHYDHYNLDGVSDYKLHIDGPGEYEIQGVFVTGLATFHDDHDGGERGKNTIYVIDIDGFTLLHLGDLGHELPKETLQKIPSVDVLMIPVGGFYTIDPEVAAKVISSIEPSIVIPMHYQTADLTGIKDLAPIDKFMDEMGVDNGIKKTDRLKINAKSDIPEETTVYILNQDH
jgi:L-ascorbate metabolism protein UlaG (beta-lactamase superfamily)